MRENNEVIQEMGQRPDPRLSKIRQPGRPDPRPKKPSPQKIEKGQSPNPKPSKPDKQQKNNE